MYYFANPLATFGEDGLTLNFNNLGCTIKSISSIGIAPNKHWSPKTMTIIQKKSIPMKNNRFIDLFEEIQTVRKPISQQKSQAQSRFSGAM